MKTITATAAMLLGLSALGMAAEFKGFVEDSSCASKPGMKDNAACAKKCIGGGSPAVLVGEDGTVYKIANQDKITGHAGEKVTVTGSVKEGTITVEDVK
jgi:hypothetical protein